MKQFLRNNGLSLCFLILFLGSWLGQIIFGLQEYNKERLEAGFNSVPLLTYLKRSEEHTSELQSRENLVCRLLLEKKKKAPYKITPTPNVISFRSSNLVPDDIA